MPERLAIKATNPGAEYVKPTTNQKPEAFEVKFVLNYQRSKLPNETSGAAVKFADKAFNQFAVSSTDGDLYGILGSLEDQGFVFI